ncbi:DUF523 domain-containing protein [Candidatus Parcubacteria bacterium]|nr:MAG: DUF523 domain-containing protein [Candidatus Parcubacteria bacterium]
MKHVLKDKIRIGVSACNFGAKVRYNRKGWDRIADLDREKSAFVWTPVCPEVMSGLGVPREAMKLVDGNGDDFWEGRARMKNKKGENVTKQLKEGLLSALDNIKRAGVEAFVFMEGSPSCGVYRTTLKNQRLGKPPGVFGSLLLREQLFLIPADDLESPVKWWDWRRRLHAFVWIKRKEFKTKKDIIEIWHDFKFLSQEVSRVRSDELGRKIASMPKKITAKYVSEVKNEILSILRLPSNINRIKSSAEKQMSHFCKHYNLCETEKLPSTETAKRKFFDRLIELEKKSISDNINYGFVPVVYRNNSR